MRRFCVTCGGHWRLFWSSFLIVEKTVRVLFGGTTSGEAGRDKKRRGHVGGHKGIGVGGGVRMGFTSGYDRNDTS